MLVVVRLLALCFLAATAEPAMKCHVYPPPEDESEKLLRECSVFRKLFPTNEAIAYSLVGSENQHQLYLNREHMLKITYHEENEDFIEEEIKRSAEEGTMEYLRVFSENVMGVWSFSSERTGEALGFHYTTEMIESIVLPETLHLNLGCEHKVTLKTICKLNEWDSHIEAGWEKFPCTYMGDCDDDCLCVEVSMYLKQCMKKEDVTPEMRVVKGPQPVWPWDNCYFSRTCAVEGYQCFLNDRFKHYARCLPEGTCPKPTGREHIENMATFGVRRLAEVTPQVFQRTVLEDPDKVGWPSEWSGPRGAEQRERRRRLIECVHEHSVNESKNVYKSQSKRRALEQAQRRQRRLFENVNVNQTEDSYSETTVSVAEETAEEENTAQQTSHSLRAGGSSVPSDVEADAENEKCSLPTDKSDNVTGNTEGKREASSSPLCDMLTEENSDSTESKESETAAPAERRRVTGRETFPTVDSSVSSPSSSPSSDDLPSLASFGMSEMEGAWNHAPSEHVNVVHSLLGGKCSDLFMDFLQPPQLNTEEGKGEERTFEGSSSEEAGEQGGGGTFIGLDGLLSGAFSDAEKKGAGSHEQGNPDDPFNLNFLDFFDDGWLDKKLRRENGGSEGWQCEEPWGPMASVETGAIPRADARLLAFDEGLDPWEVVPEVKEERRRRRLRERRRRLLQLAEEGEAKGKGKGKRKDRMGGGKGNSTEDERSSRALRKKRRRRRRRLRYKKAKAKEEKEEEVSEPSSDESDFEGAEGMREEIEEEEEEYSSDESDFEGAEGGEEEEEEYSSDESDFEGAEGVGEEEEGEEEESSEEEEGMEGSAAKQASFDFLEGFGPAGFSFSSAESLREEEAYAALPRPPESEEDGKTPCEGGGSPPSYAPEKVAGFSLDCAPQIVFAPNFESGPSINLAPSGNWAVQFEWAPDCNTAPSMVFGPAFRVGPVLLMAVENIFTPTFGAEIAVALAPVNVFLPAFIAAAGVVATPATVLPDIFENWVFATTDFGPSKLKRFDDLPVVGPKENVTDLAAITGNSFAPAVELSAKIEEIPVDNPFPEKVLKKLGIRKSLTLGAFFVTAFGDIGIVCPRTIEKDVDFPWRVGTVRVFAVEPLDVRRQDEGRLVLSENCVVPYPSDVLRDIPHLPKEAIVAIRAFEKIENKIPPHVKIALNQLLAFGTVIAEGRKPDVRTWLREFGEATAGKDLLEGQEGAGRPLSWSRGLKIAADKTPAEVLARIPRFFPQTGRLHNLVYNTASHGAQTLQNFHKKLWKKGLQPAGAPPLGGNKKDQAGLLGVSMRGAEEKGGIAESGSDSESSLKLPVDFLKEQFGF
uniref:Uncharacterized protein n=1 Tax=Chromera velia CCMP2878 TaxID=1169474 RepID=A0A0G4HWM4_9ALVE|eukprot:Cvel_9074.t1-p1 / transcript=Cvel_9074.t1 / gene=Cvel_9074 / organism=Chromera_velia_CCMP2878 / gene_product=hypothetical protein / transcript_product=hypothetical protein / location=Cvel_scaffold515:116-5350(-) / protein_length=1322 / sequence_SO=supercontig / SO=protein_coding / is_pseudo=false